MPNKRNELKLLFQELKNPYKQLNFVFLLISIIPILTCIYLLCGKWLLRETPLSQLAPILFFANLIVILGYVIGYRVIKSILNKILTYAERAKRAEEEKSAFAIALAHDLKSPLAVVKANLSNLKAGFFGNLTHPMEEAANVCNSVMDRMNAILMNLINTYTTESQMTEPVLSRFDLLELLEAQQKEFVMVALEKKIMLRSSFSGKKLFIQADRIMILRVISNLMNNAMKYTPLGGKVTLKAYATEGFARIEFQNTGSPIPEDMIEKIFERFKRLHSFIEGEGLGLAIARDIVEIHKGKIWASSAPGQPNCFTVLLPLAKE